MKRIFILILISSIVSIGTLICGFILTGSPLKMRDIKFDEKRAIDIENISDDIKYYYSYNNRLPDSLVDIPNYFKRARNIKDPETNKLYEYIIKSDTQYSLCTNYKRESAEVTSYPWIYHTKGRVCVDKDLSIKGSNNSNSNEKGVDVIIKDLCKGNNCVTYPPQSNVTITPVPTITFIPTPTVMNIDTTEGASL